MKRITKALAAIMLLTMVAFVAGCKPEDEPDNGGGNNNGGGNGGNTETHEYVDLGLPSGTLWATCNVGATTPEGYGDYFAWGETTPKTTYDWDTYKYSNGNSEQLTKYCNDAGWGYNGFTDSLTILQPTDDAATVNWGNGWCMPTHEQWMELCRYTSRTWTTQNGKNGQLFTATNGNSLFLPAAGYRWDDVLDSAGSGVSYWSSSLIIGDPILAWCIFFQSGSFPTEEDGRPCGKPVRPVLSAR